MEELNRIVARAGNMGRAQSTRNVWCF